MTRQEVPTISAETFGLELKRRTEQFVLFVGAGVSYDPPAALPLAIEWKLALVEGLLRRADIETDGGLFTSLTGFIRRVPLESVLQTIQHVTDQKTFESGFAMLSGAKPNSSHTAIAKLALEGRLACIITTNFDNCLEGALDQHNVPHWT